MAHIQRDVKQMVISPDKNMSNYDSNEMRGVTTYRDKKAQMRAL
jgi:hypothetical protein